MKRWKTRGRCSGKNLWNERASYRRLLFPASHSLDAITAGKMALN